MLEQLSHYPKQLDAENVALVSNDKSFFIDKKFSIEPLIFLANFLRKNMD